MEIAIAILGTALYMVIGFGYARMSSEIKSRNIRLVDVFFWWMGLIVYSFIGDVQ